MRLLTGTLFGLAVAAIVGLGMTYYALTRGAAFGALSIESWTAFPKIGTVEADPYARASISRTGRLPTALGDGVSFTLQTDDNGKLLDGRCNVVLEGITPAARYWTLTLYNAGGGLIANSVNRYGFTSEEIVRRADGHFEIIVAPRANPGNWLPTAGIERYQLVLRLYDTAVGVSTKAGREVPMPSVTTRSCP
ncbi:MAG TPA: DUF1214 domain-containing protein [Pseudolabrys sp.]|nr:DUF1214 domain-containing protein [Pseudolabrys sp.]